MKKHRLISMAVTIALLFMLIPAAYASGAFIPAGFMMTSPSEVGSPSNRQ